MDRRWRSELHALVLLLSVGLAAADSAVAAGRPPLPDGTLDTAQVTVLFSGKTVLSRTVKSQRESRTYYHPDGGVRQLRKETRRFGHWRVTLGWQPVRYLTCGTAAGGGRFNRSPRRTGR